MVQIYRKSMAGSVIAAFVMTTAIGTSVASAADFGPYAPAGYTNSTAIWAGVGVQEDVLAAYAGGIWAANGDLDASGFLFRGQALYVDYEFDTAAGDADGELARANASVGYQWAGAGVTASLFGGIDVQEHDFDPNGAGDLDDEVGVIVTGRVANNGPSLYPMSLEASFSTANDTYWARGRIGQRFDGFAVGPELALLGNDGFDAYRVGGYVAFDLAGAVLELNAGYHDGDGSGGGSGGGDSAYGGATVVFLF